jgi:glutathione peroxidase
MGIMLLLVALALVSSVMSAVENHATHHSTHGSGHTIFMYNVEDAEGVMFPMSDLYGKKAYLIVNVASECGFTATNYKELKILHDKFAPLGLEIIAFPCNDFGGQEPGDNDQIQQFAKEWGAEFKVMGKLECKGRHEANPIYHMLTETMHLEDITWNFMKFITDRYGRPVVAVKHDVSPLELEEDIMRVLEEEPEALGGLLPSIINEFSDEDFGEL